MNWQVSVTSLPDPLTLTQDLKIVVTVPNEAVLSLAHEHIQRSLIDRIAEALHAFTTSQRPARLP